MGALLGGPGRDLRPERAYGLPERLRPAFAEPWGPVLTTEELADLLGPDDVVLAVGDVVSLTLRELGVAPRVIVIDHKTQRGDEEEAFHDALDDWGEREMRVANPAGQLTREAWTAVRRALVLETGLPTRIVVDGEEDLVGLACFLEAPDGARVLYGVPDRGVCVVTVDDEVRRRLADLVSDLKPL